LTQKAPEHARVFFALWPDEGVRGELDRLAARLHRLRGGRRTRAETIHLTLLFIGDVPRFTLPALQAGAADIRLPAFELVFDQTECWRHNRIACATTSQPPLALMDLVTGLEGTLQRLGIPYDPRPYKPHVTLVRNADCRPDGPLTRPVRWPAREFVLVESLLCPEGAQYLRLGSYPLDG
jgi:2'-5' RNA ligase